MDAFALARLKARETRAACTGRLVSALPAVERALEEKGFQVHRVAPGDSNLDGTDAKLSREWSTVHLRDDLTGPQQACHLAHELGHIDLHRPDEPCEADDADLIEASSRAMARIAAYGPRERRELQANVYAREFLLPRNLAREMFLEERLGAGEIAARLGLPIAVVRRQLLDAILLQDVAATVEPPETRPQTRRDKSQEEAAGYTKSQALLVEAGPGSGKTRTLVARINHLLATGTAASAILALTFSNKAAAELSERVSRQHPEAATEIWSGTFHAFGLELMRRHYDRLGLEPEIRLIDRAQAVELLEDRLPLLQLRHFHDLRNPGERLSQMLRAISRAKDELVDPAAFRKMAEQALTAAGSDDAVKDAEKAVDTARVYELYETALGDRGLVDFGDLVMRPSLLLESDPEIRAMTQARHRHILVDEYQDVNRASARLLAGLYGPETCIWVVGDARQSIYRFRGASSVNMGRFEKDFTGGERTSLAFNYRSTEHIVGLCRRFAHEMRAGRDGLAYAARAARTEEGTETKLLVGADDDSEAELLAREILSLQQNGVTLSNQAVLARTNARLDVLADELLRRDIPVLQLGSFFEREEVRDVLSVLTLLAEANGGALARVAAYREIDLKAADVIALVRAARERNVPMLDILAKADSVLSDPGAQGAARLSRLLEGLNGYLPAFEVAAIWLLERTDYLRELAACEGVSADLRRAALRQLMDFLDQTELDGRPLSAAGALRRVRTSTLLADDRDLREPALGTEVDAVRLMTVHGAKGLEFAAVHVVGLHERGMPKSYRREQCPPPPQIDDGRDPKQAHEEEEECAFFVAISRAEDHLRLYHTEKAAKQSRKRSRFLDRLAPLETDRLATDPSPAAATLPSLVPHEADRLSLQDVREFEQCPLKVAYRRVMGIRARRYEGPYLKTSTVIYSVIDRLGEILTLGTDRHLALNEVFQEAWQSRGPVGDVAEAEYRSLAQAQIDGLRDLTSGFDASGTDTLSLSIGSGHLDVPAPLVRHGPSGRTVARFSDGGRSTSDMQRRLSNRLPVAAVRASLGASAEVEIAHLGDRNIVPIARRPDQSAEDLARAEAILAAIRQGRLPPKREMRICMRCAYFFSCPATGSPEAR